MISKRFQELVNLLSELPGVGKKTAEKYLYFWLSLDASRRQELATKINDVLANTQECKRCHKYTEDTLCELCMNPERDVTKLCIVANDEDIQAIEDINVFAGRYYVFRNNYDSWKNEGKIDKEKLLLLEKELNEQKQHLQEIILAIEPTINGEILCKLIKSYLPKKVKITRIAVGIPLGASINYTDPFTLKKAFEFRKEE